MPQNYWIKGKINAQIVYFLYFLLKSSGKVILDKPKAFSFTFYN